jgi:hypothetical protein
MPDGDVYEGEFVKGLKNGHGTEWFKNGDKYCGEYVNSKFHGKGILFYILGVYGWKNGSKYDGDFVNGIRCGKGKWSSGEGEDFDTY